MFLLLWFLFSATLSLCKVESAICERSEQQVLLSIKQGLQDPDDMLSSWSADQEDCCQWTGVGCNDKTGRVTMLRLPSLNLQGDVSSTISKLHNLKLLDLSSNKFTGKIPESLGQLKYLRSLHLHSNSFHGPLPASLGNLSSLKILYVRNNQLKGTLPKSLGLLSNLQGLDISYNSFHGPIPAFLGNLSSLEYLYLDNNQFNGTLPKSLWLLENLKALFIGYNSLTGIVWEVNLAKLSRLLLLGISSTSLFFNLSSHWVPPFQLEVIEMRSSKIGPKFPAWLRTQRSIKYLDFSQSGISDTAPDWFWNMASNIETIDLSNNLIDGDISNITLKSIGIDLSSNCFKGQLPRLSTNVRALNIFGRNSFSGPISRFLCQRINGKINLYLLDVSNNFLSGELSSDCLTKWYNLGHLNLGSNNLSGKIPDSMGSLFDLHSLHLHDNCFFGDIHSALKNCTDLELIDLGKNNFSGFIPSWIGEWGSLLALRLRSNRFSSNIPAQICQLSQLIILDVSNNSLSGPIPKCFNNFSQMATTNIGDVSYLRPLEYASASGFYRENLMLITKGRESEYKNILHLVRSIDLSSNKLSGSIPTEISSLYGLRFLNLSRNYLMGKIPEKMGGMTVLESLDLSRNNLSGEIPQSMSNLTFLSYLDLSYNNLSGRIPFSTQLQNFNASSYIGNVELCGAPLINNCTKDDNSTDAAPTGKNEEDFETSWFYIGMAFGFVFSFWGVCGVLLLKKTWRHAYFKFLDGVNNQVYVATMIKVNWLHQKFGRYHDGN